MVDENVALKYILRKPAQAIGGAVGGAIVCCIPGVILMLINDRLAAIEQAKPENVNNSGITGPFTDWKWPPPEIALQGAIVGLIGGAGLGLYL